MRVRFVVLALISLTVTLPRPTQAQEAERQLWDVETMSVRPDHIDEFMEAAAAVREAAVAANLGAEWGWHIWSEGVNVIIASPAQSMAQFDDPEAWMREFQGTPGEALLNETMERVMTEISIVPSKREIMVQVPEWGYEPTEPPFDTPTYAEYIEFWVAPGKYEEMQAVIADVVAFHQEHDAYYPFNGYQVMFGDVGRIAFLIFNDGWADYFGTNSLEAQMEAEGGSDEWEALMARMRDCITDMSVSQMAYHPELSYTGPVM